MNNDNNQKGFGVIPSDFDGHILRHEVKVCFFDEAPGQTKVFPV